MISPVSLHHRGKLLVRRVHGDAGVEEDGESEHYPVMGQIRGTSPRESGQTSVWSAHHEKDWRTAEKEKQMTVETTPPAHSDAETATGASFHDTLDWHGIRW